MAINLKKDDGEEKKKFDLSKKPVEKGASDQQKPDNQTSAESSKKKNFVPIIIIGLLIVFGVVGYILKSSSGDAKGSALSEETKTEATPSVDSTISSISSVDTSTMPSPENATTVNSTVATEPVASKSVNTQPSVVASQAPSVSALASEPSNSATIVKKSSVAKPNDKTHTNFAAGSASVNRINNSLVKDVLTFIAKNPNSKVTINGYASIEGDLNANQVLSQQRADKVKDYLISKGVPSSQIDAIGKGIENPIGDNNTIEGRMQNRRTELVY